MQRPPFLVLWMKAPHVNGVQSLQKACWYEPPKSGGLSPHFPSRAPVLLLLFVCSRRLCPWLLIICWFPGNYPKGAAVSLLSPDLPLLREEMTSLAVSESQAGGRQGGAQEPGSDQHLLESSWRPLPWVLRTASCLLGSSSTSFPHH